MKKLLLSLLVLLVPAEAWAIGSYTSTRLSCAEVQEIGQREGAAIMRWSSARNPGLPLYVRVVKGRFQCDHQEFAGPGFIPTSDDPKCHVVICKDRKQFLRGGE